MIKLITLLLSCSFAHGAPVGARQSWLLMHRSVVPAIRGVILSWDAPLENESFYVYSTTVIPTKLVPMVPQFPGLLLVTVPDGSKITQLTNWPLVAVIKGTNRMFFPTTNSQALFAVRSFRNGMFSPWGTHR